MRLIVPDEAPLWAHELVTQLERALAATRVKLVASADLPPAARSRGFVYGHIADGRLMYSDGAVWRYVDGGGVV